MATYTSVRIRAGCQNAASPKKRPSTCWNEDVLQYQGWYTGSASPKIGPDVPKATDTTT